MKLSMVKNKDVIVSLYRYGFCEAEHLPTVSFVLVTTMNPEWPETGIL